jgi:hypothetical protein
MPFNSVSFFASQIYNRIRQHNDIRFEVKKVEKTADKIFLLIQVRFLYHYGISSLMLLRRCWEESH